MIIDLASPSSAGGRPAVTLTATEFKLVVHAGAAAGRVQSRERLLRDVWGYETMIDTRTVDRTCGASGKSWAAKPRMPGNGARGRIPFCLSKPDGRLSATSRRPGGLSRPDRKKMNVTSSRTLPRSPCLFLGESLLRPLSAPLLVNCTDWPESKGA